MGKQNAQQVAKEVRLRQRAEIVMACQASGMTKTEWCKQNGINVDTYFKWQHQVREAAISAAENNNIALPGPLAPEDALSPAPPSNEIQGQTRGEKYQASQIEAVVAWKKSNLCAAEWCRQQGIPKSTFHKWKVKAQEIAEAVLEGFHTPAEQNMDSPQMLQPRFTELPVLPPAAEEPSPPEPAAGGTAIRIQMGGMVIEIQKEADARLAESVVRALANQC